MVSYVKYFVDLVLDKFRGEDNVEKLLEENLKILEQQEASRRENDIEKQCQENIGCLKRTGKITNLSRDSGTINGNLHFSTRDIDYLDLRVNDIVNYLYYKPSDKETPLVRVLKVIQSQSWNANGSNDDQGENIEQLEPETVNCEVLEKVLVCKVIEKNGRNVTVNTHNIKFDLDNISSTFIPTIGDWLQVYVKCQRDLEIPLADIEEILEVERIHCLRSDIGEGKITVWDAESECGVINDKIFFLKSALDGVIKFNIGDKVVYDAIESDQEIYSWRAITVISGLGNQRKNFNVLEDRKKNYDKNKNGVIISNNFDFGEVNYQEKKKVDIEIKNCSERVQTLFKAVFHSKRSESQFRILDVAENIDIGLGQFVILTCECYGKFPGVSSEEIVFNFRGFKIPRLFKIDVKDPYWNGTKNTRKTKIFKSILLERLECRERKPFIPGVKSLKPPPFVKVRCGSYKIPHNYWGIYQDYVKSASKFTKTNSEVELILSQVANHNYADKFHALQYLEEIHYYTLYRSYDMEKAYLAKMPPYLCLEIEGLFERRPSLQLSDSVKVTNPWDPNAPLFEGYIHKITNNNVYLMFCNDFHTKYDGEAVSVEFFFSRSVFIKCHFAIDLASSLLADYILFPTRIITRETQLEILNDNNTSDVQNLAMTPSQQLKHRDIAWYNKNLNEVQKEAVINALKGVTRPLPYIVFGPPGTGKTVTMVEIVMQIYCLLPNSRMLLATPSNSAANLLTERLIEMGSFTSGQIIRLASMNQVSLNKIPDKIKPYTATIDVSSELSRKSNFHKDEDGIRHSCQKNYIGRHRITVGTCVTLGSLAKMGFPAGHFTHVLVDEAGQASEPEIMIPLTLVDCKTGQIILSGDPLQLGPVVLNNIAFRHGLSESYLERLLHTFPYKRDVEGRGMKNNGYDTRLVTMLTYNYRSIERVISYSSDLFYDGNLKSKIRLDDPWVNDCVVKVRNVFSNDLDLDDYPGVIFQGVRGRNYRGEDQPSWFNPQEAASIIHILCKLYKEQMEADDIGIITPYSQQVKYIQTIITDLGIAAPKIGSVEEFQGQERKIIMLSIVRSNEEDIKLDIERYLGFISNKKRVNVAISRAQVLLVVVGNPHLLVHDPTWNSILRRIIQNNGYFGCDIPKQLMK